MPIHIVLNPESGLTVATANGLLTYTDLLRFTNNDWLTARPEMPILFDAREATASQLSADEIEKLADTVASLHRRAILHTRLAIVVAEDADFGLARMFLSLVEVAGVRNVRVFRSIEFAELWLRTLTA